MITNIPLIKLKELEFFLIQGGMGVGVSRAGLASAVAEEGGAGIIASVGLGVKQFSEFLKENESKLKNAVSIEARKEIQNELYALANQLALKEEIYAARRKTNGVIGVNIMHALSDYSSLVKAAINAGADLIISGAGIPRDLPSYLNGAKTKLIPIVSSARLAEMICKSWSRQGHPPDAMIVEGPMAGGHLGYGRRDPMKPEFTEHLDNPEFVKNGLEKIVKEVKEIVKEKNIPIIAAGGLFYGGDIGLVFEKWGVAGVQMATRFVTTNECDASLKFKQAYTNCNKEDLVIINSPVGMPGRAIKNEFLEKVERGEKIPISCPYHCLKTCIPEESPYCIANALFSALKGNFENGYVFAGSNAWRCKEDGIISVKELFKKLDQEYMNWKITE